MRFANRVPFVLLVLFGVGAVAAAQEQQEVPAGQATEFLRVARDAEQQPIALQTSIVRYRKTFENGDHPLTVDLVAAIHIGERDYFKELNQRFKQYDVVLYELVAPAEAAVPDEEHQSDHPIAIMQQALKDMLGLEFQLEHIDYKQPNFVHADMSPDQLAAAMAKRGEDPIGMFFRMMGRAIAQQARQGSAGQGDAGFLLTLLQRDRKRAMRLLLAEQFQDLTSALEIIEGPDGSSIVADRNQVVIDKLAEQIAEGKKRIAIFYGAGHMPDLEGQLVERFGLKKAEVRWLDAWNLRSTAASENDEAEDAPSAGSAE